ncbi:hypothetical protein HT031_005325 [Scenedesmus sp. PABB004]|nr:hypothetical protein HT031_005325 [Scenedesmus sp. PABB004]
MMMMDCCCTSPLHGDFIAAHGSAVAAEAARGAAAAALAARGKAAAAARAAMQRQPPARRPAPAERCASDSSGGSAASTVAATQAYGGAAPAPGQAAAMAAATADGTSRRGTALYRAYRAGVTTRAAARLAAAQQQQQQQEEQQQEQQQQAAAAAAAAAEEEARDDGDSAAMCLAAPDRDAGADAVTAAAKRSVVLQLLHRAASAARGWGRPVLGATRAQAAAAGALTARTRLLVAEVAVYRSPADCASAAALAHANALMHMMALPDGVAYMPVDLRSFYAAVAARWAFPAFPIALGSSYFQRLLVRLPQVAAAALACPEYEPYCAATLPKQARRLKLAPPRRARTRAHARPPPPPQQLAAWRAEAAAGRGGAGDADAGAADARRQLLRMVQITCLFLALKVADTQHALGLLRFCLSQLAGGVPVSRGYAEDMEATVLRALGWRLGPYFAEDDLAGNDEEAWAEAVVGAGCA